MSSASPTKRKLRFEPRPKSTPLVRFEARATKKRPPEPEEPRSRLRPLSGSFLMVATLALAPVILFRAAPTAANVPVAARGPATTEAPATEPTAAPATPATPTAAPVAAASIRRPRGSNEAVDATPDTEAPAAVLARIDGPPPNPYQRSARTHRR